MKQSKFSKILATVLLCAVLFSMFSGFSFPQVAGNAPRMQADVSPNKPPSGSSKDDVEPSEPTTTSPSKSSPIGQTLPLFDIAVKSGIVFPMQCTAPAGAEVTATIDGTTYPLSHKQKVKSSTYVNFRRNFEIPAVENTQDLGEILYTVTYKGKDYTTTSSGKLFAVGEDATLRVQVKNNSAMVFNNASTDKSSGYRTVARKGAVSTVVSYSGDMYKLGAGGWVNASNMQPLTKNLAINNPVTSTRHSRHSGYEVIKLEGATHPMFTAKQNSDGLSITFYLTSGVGSIDVSDSRVFSSASTSSSDNSTTITFTNESPGSLWGYGVEYSGGTTSIIVKPRPSLSSDEQPLDGIVIALDPGHGGKDNGTSGIAKKGQSVEKDVNLKTAKAVKEKLESQGAKVVMLRTDDSKVELSDRLDQAQEERVDLFVSIHCNSAANKKATGVEVYYHHSNSSKLAANMTKEFTAATDRKSRGFAQSHYIVTLGSFAPSILLEMGFMTNSGEYKDLCNEDGISNAADGIYNGIIATLS